MVVSPTLSNLKCHSLFPNLNHPDQRCGRTGATWTHYCHHQTTEMAPSTKAMDGSYDSCRSNRRLGPECGRHWQRRAHFSRTGSIHSDMFVLYSCCTIYQGYSRIPARVTG